MVKNANTWSAALHIIVRSIFVVVFVVFVAGGAFSAFVFYTVVRDVVAAAQMPSMASVPILTGMGEAPPQERINLPDWEQKERVNILLLGVDQRGATKGPWRTDTMILASVDPAALSASMLSIPRDLWVPIPGYSEGRINTAHFLGDAKGYPGGGPALAKKTVQYNLGVPIHYYMRVNFDGFRQAIDIIGGITIEVEEPITDNRYPDENYGYKSIYIPAGRQEMDGEMALQYARTRHGGSDFARAKRQQQVLLAIRERVLSLDLLATLPVRLPSLMRTLEGAIQTDLQPGEILALAQLASRIPSANIKTAVIDQNLTLPWRTPQGADVLIPNRGKIRLVVDELFPASAPGVAEPGIEMVSELASEGTTIEVLNGTTQQNAEQEVGALLSQQGFQVVRVGQADRLDYERTIIIDYADELQSLTLLTKMFGIAPENVRHAQNPNSDVDIRLIVGSDIPLTQ